MDDRTMRHNEWVYCPDTVPLLIRCPVYSRNNLPSLKNLIFPLDLSGCTGCRWCDVFREWNVKNEQEKKNQHLKSNPESEYAFSFTQPPDYAGDKSGRTLEQCAEYLFKSGRTAKNDKIIKGAYVQELTKAGVPHIHGVYATASGNKIQDKYFKRAWDLWDPKIRMGAGHQGGYHRPVRHSECYEDYMTKEGVVSKWLGE